MPLPHCCARGQHIPRLRAVVARGVLSDGQYGDHPSLDSCHAAHHCTLPCADASMPETPDQVPPTRLLLPADQTQQHLTTLHAALSHTIPHRTSPAYQPRALIPVPKREQEHGPLTSLLGLPVCTMKPSARCTSMLS